MGRVYKVKILLSASRKHYDFENDKLVIKHSVGILCQLFSNALREIGEVEFISDTDVVENKEYDLIVSWPRNFASLTRSNKFKKSICFLNIAEPSYLKRVMLEEAGRLGCKLSDCFTPSNFHNADLYFLIGNEAVIKQYTDVGIPREKIIRVCYRHNTIPFKPRDKNKKPIFLHLATTLGLRKGFWHVVEDFKKANLDAELWCVGKIQKETFWIDYMNSQTDPRIKMIGWVDCDSPDYYNILNFADFMVFPSFGEGQPGTIVEALEGGCIPLITEESGFEYYPLGKYVRGSTDIWERAFNLSNEEFKILQLQGQQLLKSQYDNEVFKQTIRDNILKLI